MQEQILPVGHRLTLTDRKALIVTGVKEVGSYDDHTIILTTSMGTLIIGGNDLKLKSLSLESGQASVEGTVFSLSYEEPRTGSALWHRLFG